MIEASRWLLEIPGHERAMAACASTQEMLQRVDVGRLVDGRLHEFVDELQLRIASIHDDLEASWFAPQSAAIAG